MALLTEDRVRARARRESQLLRKSATARLDEAVSVSPFDHFDVFLSHSIKDAELVDGARLELEDKGLRVYVDWIVDKNMPHSAVTVENAEVLRRRMKQCDSLLYLHTENSAASKWVPSELGYFDALKGRVAILPVTQRARDTFEGQEYLGLYPYVDFVPAKNQQEQIYANRSFDTYAHFQSWVARNADIEKRS
jgi:hypothetical protein